MSIHNKPTLFTPFPTAHAQAKEMHAQPYMSEDRLHSAITKPNTQTTLFSSRSKDDSTTTLGKHFYNASHFGHVGSLTASSVIKQHKDGSSTVQYALEGKNLETANDQPITFNKATFIQLEIPGHGKPQTQEQVLHQFSAVNAQGDTIGTLAFQSETDLRQTPQERNSAQDGLYNPANKYQHMAATGIFSDAKSGINPEYENKLKGFARQQILEIVPKAAKEAETANQETLQTMLSAASAAFFRRLGFSRT